MFKQFIKTRTCIFGLILILVLGVISIEIGKQFVNHQGKIASLLAEKQSEHIERNVEYHGEDIGLLLYYLEFTLIDKLNPLAALSIGQKDVNPSTQSVSIRTLEGQKYDTDLVNPIKLLYGNLDLSFVLIFVFPLVIIAFTYNLRSEEEETGTWRMVSVMSRSKTQFLLAKLSVRTLLLSMAMVLLYIIAGFVLDIPWTEGLLIFFITSLLYLLFWFSLIFWVITWKRSSSFNALTLLSIWLFFAILLPATINNKVANLYPIPEAFSTIIKQRDSYHTKWDTNKRKTIEKFYARYPQLKKYGYPSEEGFNWLWYYAMQHAGDEESRVESTMMQDKILKRAHTSKIWAQFVPTMHAQLAFNNIAGTSLAQHTALLRYSTEFHERTRLYFYPKIFSNVHARDVNWEQFKPEYLPATGTINWLQTLMPLTIVILILSCLSFINIRRFGR